MDNPLAFPLPDHYSHDGIGLSQGSPGMDLRDYFAGQVLPFMAGWPQHHGLQTISPGSPMHPAKAATAAYRYADAMLAARQSQGE